MGHKDITLRPGEPTGADGAAFARYVDAAADGFFGFMLGRNASEILARAFAGPGHDLSYENVTFAEQKGATVGMVAAYTAEQHRQGPKDVLKRAAGRLNLRYLCISTLFAPLTRIFHSMADGDYYIQFIAVDRECRGAGVGSLLLDAAEEKAREAGSRRLALDVAGSNRTARAFYERHGWSVTSQWPKRVPLPKLQFFRMTKGL